MQQVAISNALSDLRYAVSVKRASGHVTKGDSVIVSMKQTSVDLASKPDQTPPSIPTVEFMVCEDVTNVRVFDRDGKDITPTDRANRALTKYGVSNYKYPATDQWRVSFAEWQKGESC